MVTKNDAKVIKRTEIPARVSVRLAWLKTMGKSLAKGEAIEVPVADKAEARKIQGRWRAYMGKGKAHSRRLTEDNGKITLYLWVGE